jgi:hypothetical protein
MPFTPNGNPLLQIEVHGVALERVELRSASELALYPGAIEKGKHG